MCFWFDTLPSGDSVKVFIWPRALNPAVVLHLNGRLHFAETRLTTRAAERRGWALWGEIAGGASA